jgi:predicted short-subunit dehydrogenase-like oxidoreductase (DUF2520 family)
MTSSSHPEEPRALAIAGTGRVATALGALLRAGGFQIAAVAGRSIESAREAAGFIGCGKAIAIPDLPRAAKRILIAVSDDAVEDVARALRDAGLRGGIVLHTAAAAGPEALACLRETGNSTGVLHPLQTIPSAAAGIESFSGATFACAGDPAATAWAHSIVEAVGGKPLAINTARWHLYHAAAVFASNYQVTLMDAALELMEHAGLARSEASEALGPLLRASTETVLSVGPEHALTGPIRRGDAGSVRKHLAGLTHCLPETKRLYEAAGLRTLELAKRSGLPFDTARSIATTLLGAEN